jgi:prophage regulatory protein
MLESETGVSNMSNTVPRRFLRLPEVKRVIPISTSEIYRRISAGTFPRPVQIGAHSVAWVESEVHAYASTLIAQRNARLRS